MQAETLWHKIFHNEQLFYFKSRKNQVIVNIGSIHSEKFLSFVLLSKKYQYRGESPCLNQGAQIDTMSGFAKVAGITASTINRFKFKLYNSFKTEDGISVSKYVL